MTKMAAMPFADSAQRNRYFAESIHALKLNAVWDYVVSNNNPNWKGDPLLHIMHYHSTEHMKQVTALALWLLYRESQQPWQYDAGALPMAVACMFHDMDHSLGLLNDEANIRQAQDAFRKYLTVCDDERIKDHAEIILDLIDVTRFPYMKNRQPKNLIERCIRDADILYGMQDDALDVVMFSLRREVNRSVNKNVYFQADAWAQGRIDFLRSVEIYCPTADAIMEWLLSEDNDHNHQNKIDDWMAHEVSFRDTPARKLKACDVLFIDTEEDSTPKRRLIKQIEDIGEGFNVIFDGDESVYLRCGEVCVVVERRKY